MTKLNIEDVKIRVSAKDKNLVAQMILLEFLTRSICTVTNQKSQWCSHKRLPADKIDFYNAISEFTNSVAQSATIFNNKVQDEFLKIYSEKEMSMITESVISVIDFMECEEPKKVVALMKHIGWEGADAFWEKHSLKNEKKGA